MKFLYKEDNALIFDIGKVYVPNEDPDVDEFFEGKYKEFFMEIDTPHFHAEIHAKKKLFSTKYEVSNIVIRDGISTATIDYLEGKPAQELFQNIDYFVENYRQTILLPYFPKVDYSVTEIKRIPYILSYYNKDNFYFVANGLINGIYYENNKLIVSSYIETAEAIVPPAKLPDVFNIIFSSKTLFEVRKEIPFTSISDENAIMTDVATLINIIELPNVLALTVDEEGRHYFAVKDPRSNKVIRFYTNIRGASVWGVSLDNGKKITNVDFTYIAFYEYLKKIVDEAQNSTY